MASAAAASGTALARRNDRSTLAARSPERRSNSGRPLAPSWAIATVIAAASTAAASPMRPPVRAAASASVRVKTGTPSCSVRNEASPRRREPPPTTSTAPTKSPVRARHPAKVWRSSRAIGATSVTTAS
jgi:hypothetical protein